MELNIPFAETGNREDFPINATADQSLSLEKGYPIPYQLKPEEGGKFILRPQFNQAMYLVSKEVVDWRTQTFPNWSAELSAGLKYKKNSIVKYSDGNVYVSKIDNNTSLPTSVDWVKFEDFATININSLPNKPTPVSTDNIAIQETSGLFKKLSFGNLLLSIINRFGELTSYYLIEKVGIVDNDIFIIGDSQEINVSKKVTFGNLKSTLLTYFSAGFLKSLTTNGYIKFPTWLGGLIMQWQKVTNGSATVNFPIAFPTACLTIQGTVNANAYYGIGIISFSKTGFTYTAGGGDAFVLAIGY